MRKLLFFIVLILINLTGSVQASSRLKRTGNYFQPLADLDNSDDEAQEPILKAPSQPSPKLQNPPYNPLMGAANWNDSSLAQALVDKGVNPNKRDKFGYSPLFVAANFNALDVARILITAGSELNGQSLTKKTPLMMAANFGYARFAHFLLQQGASVRMRDATKRIAADYAKGCQHKELEAVLRLHKPLLADWGKAFEEERFAEERFPEERFEEEPFEEDVIIRNNQIRKNADLEERDHRFVSY